jgi:hypothetical protein
MSGQPEDQIALLNEWDAAKAKDNELANNEYGYDWSHLYQAPLVEQKWIAQQNAIPAAYTQPQAPVNFTPVMPQPTWKQGFYQPQQNAIPYQRQSYNIGQNAPFAGSADNRYNPAISSLLMSNFEES